jgi:hypothetical protein
MGFPVVIPTGEELRLAMFIDFELVVALLKFSGIPF